jgi:hypothetical protein
MEFFRFLCSLRFILTKELIVVNFNYLIINKGFFPLILFAIFFIIIQVTTSTFVNCEQLLTVQEQDVLVLVDRIMTGIQLTPEQEAMYFKLVGNPKSKLVFYKLLTVYIKTQTRFLIPYEFVFCFTAEDLPLDRAPILLYNSYSAKLCFIQIMDVKYISLDWKPFLQMLPIYKYYFDFYYFDLY